MDAPVRRLFGELVNAIDGPILVIGGGPSVPRDLAILKAADFRPAAVLSANEHGIHQQHFRVTHVATADGVHHEKRRRMDVYVRELGSAAPVISGAWFADYRLPDWRMAANTGLQAIALAVAMGGCPVVVTGIDFFKLYDPHAGTYFHDPRAKSSSNVKVFDNFDKQIQALQTKLVGGAQHPVRPMSGALTQLWPKWSPIERPAPVRGELPEFAKFLARTPTHVCRATGRPWVLGPSQVERGAVVACSPLEAKKAVLGAQAVEIEVVEVANVHTAGVQSDPHA